jgi:hypothetical protein
MIPLVRWSGAEPFAISDLHVRHPENRRMVERLASASADNWLIVAGDFGDVFADVEWALRVLRERFASVTWAPGNHEHGAKFGSAQP